MDVAAHRLSFERAAMAVGATANIDSVFDELWSLYREPHRAYHNATHIEHGLQLLETFRAELAQPDVVSLAYWFHDAVYKTGVLATNEADSAKLAHKRCSRMGISHAATAHIETMVLATKRHELPTGIAPGLDADLETLLDVDLSILAADRRTYACFERDVRKEYASVPEFLYLRGRKKALASFLDRTFIYHRPILRERWEAAARRNLVRALQNLDADRERASGVDADDTCIFTTMRGRLVRELPWASVSQVVAQPLRAGSAVVLLVYERGEGRPAIEVPVSALEAQNAVAAIRALPGFISERENEVQGGGGRQIVFDATTTSRS